MLASVLSYLRAGGLLLLAATLTACGGGGGAGGGGFVNSPIGGDSSSASYSLTIVTLNPDGDASLQVTSEAPLTVNVQLKGSDGSTPSNELITLATTIASVDPANGTAVTNETGVATFTLTFNGTEGAGSVQASYSADGNTITSSINIESVLVKEARLLSLNTTNSQGVTSNELSAVDPMTVALTLTEADGSTPVPDALLSLTSTVGTVAPGSGSALTDELGVARFTVSNPVQEGAGVLVGRYQSETLSLTIQKNIQAVASSDVYSLSFEEVPNVGVVTDKSPIAVTVQLTSSNQSEYPVANQIITINSSLVSIEPPNGRVRTDADGKASFSISYRGIIGAGTLQAGFSSNGESASAITAIETQLETNTSTPGAVVALSLNTFDPDGIPTREFSAVQPLTVTVQIVDAFGDPVDVDGEVISLAADVGSVSPSNGSVVTSGGLASFTLDFNGIVGAGLAEASLTIDNTSYVGSIAIQAISETPYLVSLERSPGPLTRVNPITVAATVTKLDGSPVDGGIVNFESDLGTLAPASAVTGADGIAETMIEFADESGAGTLTATYSVNGEDFSNQFNFDSVVVDPPYELSFQPLTELDGVSLNNQLSAETSLLVTVELLEGVAGLENRVVVLETESTLATVMPDNGAALTDGNGQATFLLTYGGSTGAGTLVARYDGTMGTVSDDETFESIVNPVEIGSLDDNGAFVDDLIRVEPSTTVGYLGSVELLFAVGNNIGERLISTQSIRIESPCLLNGFASLSTDSVIELTDGIGSTTYTAADACSDTTDEVTATLVQAGNPNPASATTTLSLSAAPAADERFITFISATPANIALQGTGGGVGLEERAQVTFEVRDGSGNPVAGQEVTFELSRTTGGLTLADVSATTDANGRVAATVISGTIATPVRVIATTERSPADLVNDPISVVSDSLTVSSGIVTQARFSVGVDTFNPAAAADINGISVMLTATAYDRFGNAVPDGTAVNFTSECGGIVDPENGGPRGACETVNGSCQLEWRSQPAADTVCADNRVTIMAHALGEEAFSDDNGDGYYTDGESFSDNSEAFRNDNESSDVDGPTYDAGELFIDLDNDGSFGEATPIANAPAGLYNGIACVSDGTVCSSDAISVFSNIEIVAGPLDASSLNITVEDAAAVLLDPAVDPMVPGSYVVRVTDTDGNVPPKGTVISTSSTGECGVATPAAAMSNSNTIGAFEAGVGVIAVDANEPDTSDTITIAVTIPVDAGGSGNSRNFVFACNL